MFFGRKFRIVMGGTHDAKAGLSNIVSSHSNIKVSTSKHQVSSYENHIHNVSLYCEFSDAKLNCLTQKIFSYKHHNQKVSLQCGFSDV